MGVAGHGITDAVRTSAPRLRYVVGDAAAKFFDGRQRVSDEEYVATGREMSEDEFLALTRRRYGLD